MSVIATAGKPVSGPVIITITGDSGRGKTTLASAFPKPIFSRFENGMQSIPEAIRPDAFPMIEKIDDVFDQARALLMEEHDYKTWVVDSVSAADRFFGEHILATDPKGARSLQKAAGGYGGGFDVLAAYHARMRKAAGVLGERRGINTIFIAHADTIKVEPPNEDAYMSYTLRLNKKSLPYYLDDVDVVGFLKLETMVMDGSGDLKKVISDGTRLLICHATAENVSKNRYGITEPMIVKQGENPLLQYIPSLNPVQKQSKKDEKE